jgi:hypothetical protein
VHSDDPLLSRRVSSRYWLTTRMDSRPGDTRLRRVARLAAARWREMSKCGSSTHSGPRSSGCVRRTCLQRGIVGTRSAKVATNLAKPSEIAR